MGRKISESSPRNYFTKETEEYIVRYNNCVDLTEKNKIFTEHIYYPFYKLAENIIHTFKFYNIDVDQIEDLKLDIVTMLIQEKIGKFDPSRGCKAYSYFGTIVKRWLIAYCNTNYNRKKNQIPLDTYVDCRGESKNIETAPTLTLSGFMDQWITDTYAHLEDIFPKKSDQQIADAVLTIFRTRQGLQVFKKKALYVYVREIANCETPFLTKVISKLKDNFYEKYLKFKEEGLIFDETDEN